GKGPPHAYTQNQEGAAVGLCAHQAGTFQAGTPMNRPIMGTAMPTTMGTPLCPQLWAPNLLLEPLTEPLNYINIDAISLTLIASIEIESGIRGRKGSEEDCLSSEVPLSFSAKRPSVNLFRDFPPRLRGPGERTASRRGQQLPEPSSPKDLNS